MFSTNVVISVQKRGESFYVVRNSGSVGTYTSEPYSSAALANAAGVALAAAELAATDAARGNTVHFCAFPS